MKKVYKLIAIALMICALAVSVSAYPSECPGIHNAPYQLVNPFCTGNTSSRAGSCVLPHYAPCSVTVIEATTGYECSYHGNLVEPGDVHYEHITHVDGHGITVVSEPCCPY